VVVVYRRFGGPPASTIWLYDGLQGVALSKLYYWGEEIRGLRLEDHVAQILEVLNEFSILANITERGHLWDAGVEGEGNIKVDIK